MIGMRPLIFTSLLVLSYAASLALGAGHVRDGGSFFSADAIASAEATLTKLQADRGRNVLIETFDAAPPAVADRLGDADSADARAKAFDAFGRSQQLAAGADAYIVINRKPSHLRLIADNVAARAGLDAAARATVASAMTSAFKEKQFDRGLQEGVDAITRSFSGDVHSNAATPPAAARSDVSGRAAPTPAPAHSGSASSGGIGWLPIIILAVVAFILFRAFRGVMSRQSSSNYPPGGGYGQAGQQGYGQAGYGQPGYGQQSGGFGRGLLGGLLGGVAGGYFANRAFGQDDRRGDAGFDSGNAPADNGYASSGGDFGGESSGDFGGGDSGGGGDAGGSAGGDF